jgi:hypothetical protein
MPETRLEQGHVPHLLHKRAMIFNLRGVATIEIFPESELDSLNKMINY